MNISHLYMLITVQNQNSAAIYRQEHAWKPIIIMDLWLVFRITTVLEYVQRD